MVRTLAALYNTYILQNTVYLVSLKLKETDIVANSINSTETLSGKEGTDVNGLRYRKSAQIEITSSRGTLVNNEVISKDTMNWESTQGRRWRIMEEKVKSWIKC